MQKKGTIILITGIFLFLLLPLRSQQVLTWQRPPGAIADIAGAHLTPGVSVSPSGTRMMIMERPGMPSIDDLAGEELRLAGIRFDPLTNSPGRRSYFTALKVMNIDGTGERQISGLPPDPRITGLSWSPDGERAAFTLITGKGTELWAIDLSAAKAEALTGPEVNAILGRNPFSWLPDSRHILYLAVPPGRRNPPEKSPVPGGPVVQENLGEKAAVRTFQDLLQNPYDEMLFDHYATSVIMQIDMDKNKTMIGKPGVYSGLDPSPDGNYLLVQKIQKPYSYLVPYYRFPLNVEIWDREGRPVKLVAEIPLAEYIPQGFGAVRTGPRSFSWRSDVPATLAWVEALDGGDPKRETEFRDRLFMLTAPFKGEPQPGILFKYRYGGITWGNDRLAVATEYWQRTRQVRVSFFTPGDTAGKTVFEYSSEDRYNHPGSFQTTSNASGQQVLLFGEKEKVLYLSGTGASGEGNRPFIDRYEIKTGKINRLWRSEAPWYEIPVNITEPRKGIVLTIRQSVTEVPNYYLRNLRTGRLTRVTDFPHPYPELKDVQKEMVFYTREDGVQLQFELYLPPGYRKEDGPLPAFLWAYPTEYKSADAAGQVSGSPYSFIRISNTSPILWVTQGYAILNNTSFPVIGEGEKEPNDSFVEQLVANARAAIDKAAAMGVVDPRRVAVGGHSYGAFMTANLLAHSDLFAAGIARSGAYNRTLTPFGFQAEPRTYWEAPEVYNAMSPFMHADKINEPILLVHGMADNNSGTFPIQTERLYAAIKGHGGTARMVLLPLESHGYAARESVLHMLWETHEWLERFVKNRK